MRTTDLLMAAVAATVGFGAVVAAAEGGTGWALAFASSAAVLLALTAWMSRRAPRIVVVGDPADRHVLAMRTELDHAAFAVRRCPGPERRPGGCPAAVGAPCPLADHQLGVVIHRHSGDSAPLPPCGRALGVPVVEADEHVTAAGLERSFISAG